MNTLKAALATCAISIAALGCGSTPPPEVLTNVNNALADQATAQKAGDAAPDLFQESREYQRKANEAFEDGDVEEATHLATLSQITLDTALERWRTQEADRQIAAAKQRQRAAQSTQEDEEKRDTQFKRRVARMEKLIDLQATAAKTEAQKQKLAEEMKAALELEKKQREVQNMISAAAGRIKVAEAVEASKVQPKKMAAAKKSLADAEAALAKKDFEKAKAAAMTAEKTANAAAAAAREQYAAKQKEMDLLAERKALFDEANQVGASGVKQEERGVVITLQQMFAPGKNEVMEDRAPIVERIATLAKKYTNYPIIVEGYTDSAGSQNSNLALSTSRAQSMVELLVSKGQLDFNRVKSVGYGESKPIADNSTRKGRAKNRRIEVVFLFR